MDILSESTQGLLRDRGFRQAVHKILDRDDQSCPVTVTTSTGKQVEITRVPSTSTKDQG